MAGQAANMTREAVQAAIRKSEINKQSTRKGSKMSDKPVKKNK